MKQITPHIVLASGSPYRKKQLEQLQLQFDIEAANIDETPKLGELPEELAMRLAYSKATKVNANYPDAFVIGCDQVAEIDGRILGKPHTIDRAEQQLSNFSGRTVKFHSAICLIKGDKHQVQDVITDVEFRQLDHAEILRYLEREQPLDCAGSFKCEGLGIALFRRITSDDPSAIIGLPLIALCQMLRSAGYSVL